MKAKALALCEVQEDNPAKRWREDAGLMAFLQTFSAPSIAARASVPPSSRTTLSDPEGEARAWREPRRSALGPPRCRGRSQRAEITGTPKTSP